MAPLGYLEVLDPKGRVSERYKIEAFPVTIGRAYTSHIIVDDPFICPEHAAISQSETGQLTIDDLGSLNGLRSAEGAKPVKSLPLHPGDKFRLGHTTLRYCAAETPIAPTQLDRVDFLTRLGSPYVATGAGLLVTAALALDFFLGSFERVTLLRVVTDPIVVVSTLALWAGFWSFVSRIVFGRLYFAQHFAIVCGAMLASLLLNEISEWGEFFLPSTQATWIAAVFGSAIILAAAVFGHLGFASSMRWPSRMWAGLLVSSVVIGVGVINDYVNRDKFSTAMDYSGIVKPVEERFVPAVSVERFLSRTQAMKKELDLLAQKAKAAQP